MEEKSEEYAMDTLHDLATTVEWDTGSLANYYQMRGVTAPHTGKPISEALLLGISGGIVMGYFTFNYQGTLPQARILTRNTFDPMSAILERLGIVQNIVHSTSADKGRTKLEEALDNGTPAIVWGDAHSMPYTGVPILIIENYYAMLPFLVIGLDQAADTATIIDRSRATSTLPIARLDAVRGRVKKFKYRMMTPDAPNWDKLNAAVHAGIWDTIKLYTEKPPKGSRHNFGFAAYKRLAELLVKPKGRDSWENVFPPGVLMFSGLSWIFCDINTFGKDGQAERHMYADFLEEASQILEVPQLGEPARLFRKSARAWDQLSQIIFPADIGLFKQTADLLLQRHTLYRDQGGSAENEITEINNRMQEIQSEVESEFPIDKKASQELLAAMRDQVMVIHDIEGQAVSELIKVMSA